MEIKHLFRDNPGTFNPKLEGGLPTSIDLLEHGSPILCGIQRLPIPPTVKLHSIIGTGRALPLAGSADGVVPVESARHPHVESELYFDGRHTEMPTRPETIAETKRILRIRSAEELPFTPISQ